MPKSGNIHPRTLDKNIDQYIKDQMKKSLIMSTGISPRNETQLPPNFFENYYKRENASKLRETKRRQSLASAYKVQQRSLKLKEKKMQAALQDHRNQKIQEKIQVSAPKKYYDNLPIKPGFLFFECLLRAPRGDIKELELNIPETLYYTDKHYYLYTMPNGRLNYSMEVHCFEFMRIIEKLRKDSSDTHAFNRVAAVMRGKGNREEDMIKFVLDWGTFRNRMSSNEAKPWTMTQKFLRLAGGRPSVTRLHYFPHEKSNRANFAYFVNSIALNPYEEDCDLQKCVVNTDKPSKLEVFTMSGGSILPFEKEASKVVKYLNKGYNVRIQEIILDFLKDEEGTIWFCGCKGLRIDTSTLVNALFLKEDWSPYQSSHKPSECKKGLMSFVHCKLCRLNYPNHELQHLVSVRMLILYKMHVNQRMELPWDTSHLKVATNDMLSQSVRICQYCYMLVTCEFELIEVEQKMASMLAVSIKETAYEEDPRLIVQLQFLPKELKQWRILMVIENMFDFESITPSDFYLHYKFGKQTTSFPFEWKVVKNKAENCIFLNILKVHYLFCDTEKSIKQFLNSFSLEIQLSESQNPNEKIVCKSKEPGLSELSSSLPLGYALCQRKQTVLFDKQNKPMCTLGVVLGISCDKVVQSKKIKVLMDKYQEVYVPESHYFTVDPLPTEWMELFGMDPEIQETFGPSFDEKNFYQSQLNKEELRRMKDLSNPFPPSHSEKSFKRPFTAKNASLRSLAPVKLNHSKKHLEVSEEFQDIYKAATDYLGSRPTSTKKTKLKAKHSNSSSSLGQSSSRVKQQMQANFPIIEKFSELP